MEIYGNLNGKSSAENRKGWSPKWKTGRISWKYEQQAIVGLQNQTLRSGKQKVQDRRDNEEISNASENMGRQKHQENSTTT